MPAIIPCSDLWLSVLKSKQSAESRSSCTLDHRQYRQYLFPFAGKVWPCVTHRPTKNMPLLFTMLVYVGIYYTIYMCVCHFSWVMCLNWLMLFAVPRNASKLGQIVFTPLRIWCCRHLQDHVGNLLPREVYAGHLGRSQQPWWSLMEGLMFMAYTRWVHAIQDMLRLHYLAHIPLGQIKTQLQTSHNWLQEWRTVGLRDVGRFPCVYRLFINSMYVQPGCPSEVTAPPPDPAWSMLPRWRSPTRTGSAGWCKKRQHNPRPWLRLKWNRVGHHEPRNARSRWETSGTSRICVNSWQFQLWNWSQYRVDRFYRKLDKYYLNWAYLGCQNRCCIGRCLQHWAPLFGNWGSVASVSAVKAKEKNAASDCGISWGHTVVWWLSMINGFVPKWSIPIK